MEILDLPMRANIVLESVVVVVVIIQAKNLKVFGVFLFKMTIS